MELDTKVKFNLLTLDLTILAIRDDNIDEPTQSDLDLATRPYQLGQLQWESQRARNRIHLYFAVSFSYMIDSLQN